MKEQPQINNHIRTLIGAQTHDEPWIKAVAEALEWPVEVFTQEHAYELFWRKEWGAIEILTEKEQITVAWHRPDGAQSLADGDQRVAVIERIARFALCARLIEKIKEHGELSFVIPGYPREWRQCKVYLDGHEVHQTVMADAVLNHVDAIVQVGGRVVPDTNGNIPTQRLTGDVRIMVYTESQLFF